MENKVYKLNRKEKKTVDSVIKMSKSNTTEGSLSWEAEVKILNRLLYDTQKLRIALGNMILAKEGRGETITKRMAGMYQDMEALEKKAEGVVGDIVLGLPVWEKYLKGVRGIGIKLASSLIAEIGDISKFDTISKLWAYFALTPNYVVGKCSEGHDLIMSSDHLTICPVMGKETTTPDGIISRPKCGGKIEIIERVYGKAPKRKANHHYLFNTRGKTLAWKIAGQFLKQGDDEYRNLYYQIKENEKLKNPEIKDGHAHNRALRKVAKVFLANLWLNWRELEGLPIRMPYAHEKLGHTTMVGYTTH